MMSIEDDITTTLTSVRTHHPRKGPIKNSEPRLSSPPSDVGKWITHLHRARPSRRSRTSRSPPSPVSRWHFGTFPVYQHLRYKQRKECDRENREEVKREMVITTPLSHPRGNIRSMSSTCIRVAVPVLLTQPLGLTTRVNRLIRDSSHGHLLLYRPVLACVVSRGRISGGYRANANAWRCTRSASSYDSIGSRGRTAKLSGSISRTSTLSSRQRQGWRTPLQYPWPLSVMMLSWFGETSHHRHNRFSLFTSSLSWKSTTIAKSG